MVRNYSLVYLGAAGKNEPCHEIMVLFVLRKLILQTGMRSHHMGLDVCCFGWTLRLLPYFMCVNSEDSGETVQMRRLP